jgi:hypothetical protein
MQFLYSPGIYLYGVAAKPAITITIASLTSIHLCNTNMNAREFTTTLVQKNYNENNAFKTGLILQCMLGCTFSSRINFPMQATASAKFNFCQY